MLKPYLSLLFSGAAMFAAFSASTNYSLQNYGIGSGGTNTASSPSYFLNGNTGEVIDNAGSGGSDTGNFGSTQANQANVPLAPTLDNGSGTYYNKLNCIINTSGSDASDYSYAIAVSANGFATTLYVQADGTLGASQVFQSYATWGASSGSFITGLTANTTYQVKVSARQGSFSQSAYGAATSSATANPSVSFSLSTNSLNITSLLPNTVTNSPNMSTTFSTNAANGGSIYVAGQNAGLKSTVSAYTIPSASVDLASATQGFGLQVLLTSQSSGATLNIVSPYNVGSTSVGGISTSYKTLVTSNGNVVNGSASMVLKAKAAAITPAANDYQEVLTFIAAANF